MFSKFKEFLRRVGAGPRSTSTTRSERDYERSHQRTSSAGSDTPACASCRGDPLYNDTWLTSMPPTPPRFPVWFPPDCPPSSAGDAHGVVFRFVANDPVNPGDFLSHYELGLALQANPCRRCSLSVYKSQEIARTKLRGLRMRNPKRAEKHIARGELTPAVGKPGQAGQDPDHYEWWAFDGVERHQSFRVVERLEA